MEKNKKPSLINSNQLKFIHCSNVACKKLFVINKKEVEHGNGVFFCPECFPKSRTHHTVECASCLTIIDFLAPDLDEEITTYYTKKCTFCNGTIEDEIKLSKFNTIEFYTHC